jgi:hypothetical protein
MFDMRICGEGLFCNQLHYLSITAVCAHCMEKSHPATFKIEEFRCALRLALQDACCKVEKFPVAQVVIMPQDAMH